MTVLTEKEAAAYCSVSASTLRQSRVTRKSAKRIDGPPWLKIGRAVRYDTADLDAWLASQRVEAADAQ